MIPFNRLHKWMGSLLLQRATIGMSSPSLEGSNYRSCFWMTIEVIMTVSFFAALPPVIFYITLQRYIVEGVALTGLKG